MTTSKLIKGDTPDRNQQRRRWFLTRQLKSATTAIRQTASLKPVYNKYKSATTKPKVFGYYTDWSQYDGRLQGSDAKDNRGRGYDLTNVSPTAYDKNYLRFSSA